MLWICKPGVRFLPLLAALFLSAAGVRADEAGITVTGSGAIKAKPSIAEISAVLTVESDTAGEALTKHQTARKKAMEKLDALKIDGLIIEAGSVAINQAFDPTAAANAFQNPAAAANARQRISASETVKLTLKHLDRIEPKTMNMTLQTIVDGCKDAGFALGPTNIQNIFQLQIQQASGGFSPGLITFKLDNLAELREQAVKAAVEDAWKKARRLADLTGVSIGRALAVSEGQTQTNDPTNLLGQIYGLVKPEDVEPSAGSYTDITVNAKVTIRFESTSK